jgi:hypothetical protein
VLGQRDDLGLAPLEQDRDHRSRPGAGRVPAALKEARGAPARPLAPPRAVFKLTRLRLVMGTRRSGQDSVRGQGQQLGPVGIDGDDPAAP